MFLTKEKPVCTRRPVDESSTLAPRPASRASRRHPRLDARLPLFVYCRHRTNREQCGDRPGWVPSEDVPDEMENHGLISALCPVPVGEVSKLSSGRHPRRRLPARGVQDEERREARGERRAVSQRKLGPPHPSPCTLDLHHPSTQPALLPPSHLS